VWLYFFRGKMKIIKFVLLLLSFSNNLKLSRRSLYTCAPWSS